MGNGNKIITYRFISKLITPVSAFIIFFIISVVCACLFVNFSISFYMDKQANIKIKNPNNIKQGCLHYIKTVDIGSKYNNIQSLQFQINRIVFNDIVISRSTMTDRKFIIDSPIDREDKVQRFYQDVDKYKQTRCYYVSYLYLDYIIKDRIYLYDYLGVR